MTNKFYSYYRVSSDQQRDGTSLSVQRDANLEYANSRGFVIAKEFEEVESASKVGKRKGFYEMIEAIKTEGDIAGIIFHDVDRITRSWHDWIPILDLITAGYQIYTSRERTQIAGRTGLTMAEFKVLMATDFARNLSQEVKKGMYRRIEEGYSVFGHAPVGYVTIGKGVREIDPIQGSLVKEAFEMYASGEYSLLDLEPIMYEKGLRSEFGNKIPPSRLCKMFNNRYYLGLVTVKGKIYQGKHQPLVDEVLFNKVQMVKARRFVPKLKKNDYKYLNMLHCGNCGKRLRSTTAKHKYHYYYCRNKECGGKPIREELIEKWIIIELKKFQFTPEQVDEMIKKARESKKSLALAMYQKRQMIQLQLQQVKARLGKLVERDLDGEIPKEIYDKKRDEFNSELKNLEGELVRLIPPGDSGIDRILELAKLLADPVYAYQNGNWQQKRKLVDSLMKNIKIMPGGMKYDSVLS